MNPELLYLSPHPAKGYLKQRTRRAPQSFPGADDTWPFIFFTCLLQSPLVPVTRHPKGQVALGSTGTCRYPCKPACWEQEVGLDPLFMG